MAAAFDKILIPVDFSLNTEIAVKKAVELVGSDETVIHLLHVIGPGKTAKNQFREWVAERDLHQWKYKIQQAGPHIRVKIVILRGKPVLGTIVECATLLRPNLVIIGRHNNHRRWFLSGSASPDIAPP